MWSPSRGWSTVRNSLLGSIGGLLTLAAAPLLGWRSCAGAARGPLAPGRPDRSGRPSGGRGRESTGRRDRLTARDRAQVGSFRRVVNGGGLTRSPALAGLTRLWAVALAVAAVVLGSGWAAQPARADGDPGSDVLVYNAYFVASDAGLTVAQQAQLGDLLQSAVRAGFPVRVAIIATPADLGAVTALWRNPSGYASFLGIELSLAYKQRLLVVMPNGFGINWPGHSTAASVRLLSTIAIHPGGSGLLAAAQSAVRSLASAAGVRLGSASSATAAPASTTPASTTPASTASASGPAGAPAAAGPSAVTSAASPGQATDTTVALVAVGLLALAAVAVAARTGLRRGFRFSLPGVAVVSGLGVLSVVVLLAGVHAPAPSQSDELAWNPYVDPGTPLASRAPDFTLSDQFGQPISLDAYRGKVVLLAFNDSECTTICPMTTTAMLDAKAMLGSAASRVQLLGVDANPASTSLEDVWSYSQLHGMLHAWHFLTGTLPQLRRVWKAYAVEAAIFHGQIAHTPALFVISPQGVEAKVYITQQSYSSVGQFAQVLAVEASQLLPGHPAVHSHLSYAPISTISPSSTVALPRSVRDARPGCICSSPPGIRRSPASPATSTRSTATRTPPPVPACRR
jgi:cytochrome oxidase Cu insertion factor (SCO1/SenC/PrrC family)